MYNQNTDSKKCQILRLSKQLDQLQEEKYKLKEENEYLNFTNSKLQYYLDEDDSESQSHTSIVDILENHQQYDFSIELKDVMKPAAAIKNYQQEEIIHYYDYYSTSQSQLYFIKSALL